MPFQMIQSPDEDQNFKETRVRPRADQPPIFIIPGVLGNSIEVRSLAELLDKLNNGRRSIYVYNDERLENKNSSGPESLDDHALSICNQLPPIPYKDYHALFVGFSFGCIMLAKLKNLLMNKGYAPHYFLIDGPAPWASIDYFNENKIKATEDLKEILNYAAALSSLSPITLEDSTITMLANQSLRDRFTYIANLIKTQEGATNSRINTFSRYANIALQNLENLCRDNAKPQGSHEVMLERINLLITEKTVAKYSQPLGGWERYAKQINRVEDPKLSQQKHGDLLVGLNCDSVAKIIHETFKKEVPKVKVFEKEFCLLLEEYMKSNPEVPRHEVLGVLSSFVERHKSCDSIYPDATSSIEIDSFQNDSRDIEMTATSESDHETALTSAETCTNEIQRKRKAKHQHSFFNKERYSNKIDDDPTTKHMQQPSAATATP